MLSVYILTTHNKIEDIFGSTCVFNTLRTGFPTARITVVDNYSYDNKEIQTLAEDNDCNFIPLIKRMPHHEFIRITLNSEVGEVVFLDPDVIFYESVENDLKCIPSLLSGRFCPDYYNEVVQANEFSRFHTSLLYIKSASRLNTAIKSIYNTPNFPFDPVAPVLFNYNNKRNFYDTCAQLYHSISDKENFDVKLLYKFTHLVSGSMLNFVSGRMENGEALKLIHEKAKNNPDQLQGLWREHDRYYLNHPHK